VAKSQNSGSPKSANKTAALPLAKTRTTKIGPKQHRAASAIRRARLR
jgi:hypothetical protein